MGNTLPIVPELWLCGGLATKRVTGDCRDGETEEENLQFFVVSMTTVDRLLTQ